MQKIHQSSAYKEEASGFLLIAFTCSLIYSAIISKNLRERNFSKKHVFIAIICGLCTYAMNFLNLKLSGIIPSQLFFPLINGSAIILSSLMSVLFFNEKLSKKQLVGLSGGILSLVAICLVK